MENDAINRAVRLALLEKNPEEREQFTSEIEKIISFVGEVRSVDTSHIARADDKINVFRDDTVTVTPGTYRDQMLEQAPATFRGWFLSKKIL